MTDLSTIRVIPFYGTNEEWPTWSKKFLAKAYFEFLNGDDNILLEPFKEQKTL
jgi:hypothetical protein